MGVALAVLVIATDIPSALRRAGEYRGVLHETDGPGGDVRAGREVGAPRRSCADAVGRRRRRRGRVGLAAPTRPVYLEIATDLLAAEVARRRAAPSLRRRDGRRARLGRGGRRALDAAERPLLWVGGGARDAATAVAALAERLAAPVLTTYGAAGMLPPGHPCAVGLPPHAEAAGALWDEADVVLAIGSDLDGVQTQNFAQPQPATLIAVSLEPLVELPRRRPRSRARRARSTRALAAERAATRGGLDALAERCAASAPRRAAALDAAALRFLDAIRFAVPADGVLVVDMCIPGYWLAGFHTPAAPAPPAGPARLGHARLRLPRRARRRAGRHAARSSRSPATAASCSPAASSPRWPRSRSR